MLEQLIIPENKNKLLYTTGMDNPASCLNKKHFDRYPWKIDYQYNSRGFRDHEWPDNLNDVIWCIGDSFTTGIGVPLEHTWWKVLHSRTNKRCINISMDGASNDWILRQLLYILQHFPQAKFVVVWSFITRNEIASEKIIDDRVKTIYNYHKETIWPNCNSYKEFLQLPKKIQKKISKLEEWKSITDVTDQQRRDGGKPSDHCVDKLFNCIDTVERVKGSSKIVHSFVPGFACEEDRITTIDARMLQWSKEVTWLTEIQIFDVGRDGFHFDIKSATRFVERVLELNVL